MVAPSDQEGLQGGKTIQQRSEFFASLVSNASTSSLAHALVRSLHTCTCVYYSESTQLSVVATLLLLLRSWDPWLRRTSRPQCGYILTSLNKRTNRIGDLTRHRVSWGSPLMVPLRVHMLSIDYHNYQIQKIKVINKTGHSDYWTRHKETLNCQPI